MNGFSQEKKNLQIEMRWLHFEGNCIFFIILTSMANELHLEDIAMFWLSSDLFKCSEAASPLDWVSLCDSGVSAQQGGGAVCVWWMLLDEEWRYMFRIHQSHLTVFYILFVWLGGPCQDYSPSSVLCLPKIDYRHLAVFTIFINAIGCYDFMSIDGGWRQLTEQTTDWKVSQIWISYVE